MAKVSLKKARRIESALQNKLDSISMARGLGERDVIVTGSNEAATLAKEKFDQLETLVMNLTSAINHIRDNIRIKNEESSINNKIQQIANLEREKRSLESLSECSISVKWGKKPEYGSRERAIHEKGYEARINTLKFKISELKDSINGQNASLEFELSKATQEVAESLGIPVE